MQGEIYGLLRNDLGYEYAYGPDIERDFYSPLYEEVLLLFLNGLPVVLVELKSPSREETDASEAYRQLRNYMQEIPSMFIYNAICVMSDQLTSNIAGFHDEHIEIDEVIAPLIRELNIKVNLGKSQSDTHSPSNSKRSSLSSRHSPISTSIGCHSLQSCSVRVDELVRYSV